VLHNLLIVVIPAKTMAAFDYPAHASVVPAEPSVAERNPCQAVSHARCSASSARPMPTAIGSLARLRLRLLLTTRPRLCVAGYKRACTDSRRRTLQCQRSAGWQVVMP